MAMAMSSAYPPPPPFYRLYKDYEHDPSSAPEPPPPVGGSYQLFGATYTTEVVLPSLEHQGVCQLYPKGQNIDFKKELRTLNRELQLHILELADILVERPSQYARRVEDISLIFKNLHHLLNSLRPHQARATLIHMLENQIQRRKQAIEDIKHQWYRPLAKENGDQLFPENAPLYIEAATCMVMSLITSSGEMDCVHQGGEKRRRSYLGNHYLL